MLNSVPLRSLHAITLQNHSWDLQVKCHRHRLSQRQSLSHKRRRSIEWVGCCKKAVSRIQKISPVIIGQNEVDDGLILSLRSMQFDLAWERCRQLQTEDAVVKGKIVDSNKGGVVAEVEGLKGFVPFSQISTVLRSWMCWPLVSLPAVGSRVVYFPQGHSEQVAVSTNKEVDAHIPNVPSLPPQLVCQLHNLTMHADVETDEVYAQMTLQPLNPQEQKEAYLPAELGTPSKQPTNYFCKTLTASDTSTLTAYKLFPLVNY